MRAHRKSTIEETKETAESFAQRVAARLFPAATWRGATPFYPEKVAEQEGAIFLPRLDPRDTLILKSAPRAPLTLRITSDPADDFDIMEALVRKLLPGNLGAITLSAGATDGVIRLYDLFSEASIAGAIIPQWILSEVLHPDFPDRELTDAVIKSTRVVLPLSRRAPCAGQGTIVIFPVSKDHSQIADDRSARSQSLSETESYLRGTPTSFLSRPFGEVVWRGKSTAADRKVSINAKKTILPRATSREAIWPPHDGATEALERLPLSPTLPTLGQGCGLVISKSEALPQTMTLSPSTIVVVPGNASWDKLTARGVHVAASFDGLGEEELSDLKVAFPEVMRWFKLGHMGGIESVDTTLLATYRLAPTKPAPRLEGYTHFFWRSGSQFEYYLASNPDLPGFFHGSGPGHTATTIQRKLKSPSQSGVFASFEDFLHEVN